MTDAELVEHARTGDEQARRTLVQRSNLRTARVILGDDVKEQHDALRELARAKGPAPALGIVLASIARHPEDELKRALTLVYRQTDRERWDPDARARIREVVVAHARRLGAELVLAVLAWTISVGDDRRELVHAAATALAEVPDAELEDLRYRDGFSVFVLHGHELLHRWAASSVASRVLARTLLSDDTGGVVPVVEDLWIRATDRVTWAAALGEATGSSYGRVRDVLAGWSWQRFVDHPDERPALYRAFSPWFDRWTELRNAMPAQHRPGGESAAAHVTLWGGLDLERLAASVGEAARFATDADWGSIVDTAFDLAERAPHELRRHALAGACSAAHEVTNRAREHETPDLGVAADRLIARTERINTALRASGALIDDIVANRVDDLETDVRLIREARERRAEHAARDAERADERRRHEQERARLEEERRAAELAAMQAQQQLATAHPNVERTPIDDEVFFMMLPAASTLLAYARLFRRLTQPNGLQSLEAEGVSLPMVGVINQTWATLFQQRPELALRFSTLISAPWA